MAPATKGLTPRQQQVYDLLVKGKHPNEIAKKLRVSATGIYGHMGRIKAKGFELPEASGNGSEPHSPEADVGLNGKVARSTAVESALDSINNALAVETQEAEVCVAKARTLKDELDSAEQDAREAKARIDALATSRETLETATA